MEFEEKEPERDLDLLVLLDDFLKAARRHLLLGLVLVMVCAGVLTALRYRSYTPSYTAYASFTVKVANPLYASVSSYNTKTAEQLATTFPYILTSGVLQQRVMEKLDIAYMPSVSVTASTSTSIITMSVTHSDPQLAWNVLEAVMEAIRRWRNMW